MNFEAMVYNGVEWVPMTERNKLLLDACNHYQEYMLNNPETCTIRRALLLEACIKELEGRV